MTRLKTIREKTGMSQSQFTKAAGVNAAVYQHYEQGYRQVDGANIKTLLRISITAKCRISDLIEDDELRKELKKNGY